MVEQLLQVKEFEQLTQLLSGADNSTRGISDLEIQHLCWLAAQVPEGGSVVEIGSHRGKSTCALGCGLRAAGHLTAKIYAIDLWTLGKGRVFEHYSSQETWEIFNKQVTALGLSEIVNPRMMSSEEAASKRKRPVHLLFVDGGHKYQDVHEDYLLWNDFIPAGGRIAFHDFGTRFKGVDQTVQEAMATGGWEEVHVYQRIWSAKRR